jgi:hypothetical protein
MKTWLACGAGLLTLATLTSLARAQAPSPPGVPATPDAAAGAASPPTTAPGTTAAPSPGGFNIWNALCPPDDKVQKCKQAFCDSQFGKLFSNSLAPVSLFSGGTLSSCCPPFNPQGLQQDPTTPEGAADRIKQEEAEAKKRRADVRYLGTVDCQRFPEAKAALIKALRTDSNECVRWEAAMALGNGCCCNKETIEALNLTVSGSDKDKNPVECSPRVRAAALHALQHCLEKCCDIVPTSEPPLQPPEKPEKADQPESAPPPPAAAYLPPYYRRLQQEPLASILDKARRTVAQASKAPPQDRAPGNQGVLQLAALAVKPSGQTTPAPAPLPPSVAAAPAAPAKVAPPRGQRDLGHLLMNSVGFQRPPEPPAPANPVQQVAHSTPQPVPVQPAPVLAPPPSRSDNMPVFTIPTTPRQN